MLRLAQAAGQLPGRGHADRAVRVLGEIGEVIESGRFTLPVARTFPLAEAHREGERGDDELLRWRRPA